MIPHGNNQFVMSCPVPLCAYVDGAHKVHVYDAVVTRIWQNDYD
jgi:hypothetical protein